MPQISNSVINHQMTVLIKDILFNIADWLFFETLLLEIGGQTISYATFKKRQTVDRQAFLQLDIQELENAETLNVTLFEEKQKELQDLRNHILRGKLI